ncbi:MAG TPA: tripartite tricarboxylate transporter substrate binding protein [Bordetella sp.]
MMKQVHDRLVRRVGAFAAAMLAAVAVSSQAAHAAGDDAADYPSKPITLLVGFTAGGPSDTAARILANRLSGKWHDARIIVENRPGANGAIAAAQMVQSPADGYTLFLVTHSHVNLKWLYSKLAFDPAKDFQPVAELLTMPHALAVGPSVKERDYAALAADIKAKPDVYTAASSGNGSDPHLVLAEFMEKTGLKIRHIPYRGAAPEVVDMLSGRVDMTFETLGGVLKEIQQGKLRALAIGGTQRDPQLPDVPTFIEAGVKDFSPESWYGVMAPAGTPMAIVDKINAAVNEVMNTPEGAKMLATLGALPVKSSVEDFTRLYHHDIEANGELIKSLNIAID